MRKITSVLLAIFMMLSATAIGFTPIAGAIGANSGSLLSKVNLDVSIKLDKHSYAKGEEVPFTVVLSNNSLANVGGIKMYCFVRGTHELADGSQTPGGEIIKAGRSRSYSMKARYVDKYTDFRSFLSSFIHSLRDFIHKIKMVFIRIGLLNHKSEEVSITANGKVTRITVYAYGKSTSANPVDEPATQPTQPAEPATQPSTEPTEPTEPSTEPTEPIEPSTEPTEPTEPSTEPQPTYYRVTFNYNYTNAPSVPAQEIESGNLITVPTIPEREDFEFAGWFKDASLNEEYRFNTNTPVNENLTLYAKWNSTAAEQTNPLDQNDSDIDIHSFSADAYDILINTPTDVIFTAEIFSNSAFDEEDVYVSDENENVLGYMKDDGENADETANDGIYTLKASLSSETVQVVQYYAVAKEEKSTAFSISFYQKITEECFSAYEETVAALSTVVEEYLDEDGCVKAEDLDDALNAVAGSLDALIESGEVLSYEKHDSYIKVTLSNGITFRYELKVSGVDAGIGTGSIATFQPYKGTYPTELDEMSQQATDGSAEKIVAEFEDYSFDKNYDANEVTFDSVKNFSDYSVILWHGHGGYDEELGSFLGTGEEYTAAKSSDFSADISAGRVLLVSSSAGTLAYAISGGFIEKYVGNLANSMIYLGACESGVDMLDGEVNTWSLTQALLLKGATAVIANNETICTYYNTSMMRDIVSRMCEQDEDNDQYYTLSEAMQYAFSINGDYCCEANRAAPVIFPRNDIRALNYRFAESNFGWVEGTIKDAQHEQPIENALIRIYNRENLLVASERTTEQGKYEIKLPAGEYVITVSAADYKQARVLTAVSASRVTYLETFLLLENTGGQGLATGFIKNAVTGQNVFGVTLTLRKNWNNRTGEIITTLVTEGEIIEQEESSNHGAYSIELEAGSYTMECSKTGFVTTFKNITVSPYETPEQNVTISPIMNEGEYRVVLTWGIDPSDLDSHLFGSVGNEDGYNYHVYYSNKNGYDSASTCVANLDVDDVTSYGPETTTFTTQNNGTYDFYIDWYSGSGTWATSGGKVEVYKGEVLMGTYYVPSVDNRSGSWKVFSVSNGVYTSYNTIQAEDIYESSSYDD